MIITNHHRVTASLSYFAFKPTTCIEPLTSIGYRCKHCRGIFLLLLGCLIASVSAGQTNTFSSLVYKQIDSVGLRMDVYQPTGIPPSEKRPAVIFFFGGGWINGNLDQFRPYAEYYSGKGLVTILAEYGVFSKHKTSPLQSLKDAKSAIRYLRIHSDSLGIDTNGIIAAGGSAGGQLAAACYTNLSLNEDTDSLNVSPQPDALVLFNPVIDNGPEGYGFARISKAFPDFSPMHMMRENFPPTIFFLGTNDKLIPVKTGELFVGKIKATGSLAELHLFENQQHGFFNNDHYRNTIIPLIDQFFSRIPWIASRISLN